MKKAVVVVLAVIAVTAFIGARGALEPQSGLEGTWDRDESKSDPLLSGGAPVADARVTLTIARAGDDGSRITVQRAVKVARAREVRELTYSTDGGRNVNHTLRGVEIKSTSRLDGGVLTIDGRGEIETTTSRIEQLLQERWTLSPDGRILTIASTVTVPGREILHTEVYTRHRWYR